MTGSAREPQTARLTLPQSRRLRRSADFQRVYRRRASVADGHLVVYADATGLPFSRVGVSVSRKHGSAVRRNRLKRLLREAYRLTRGKLPQGYDFILIPRRPFESTLEALTTSLPHLAREAATRADEKARKDRKA